MTLSADDIIQAHYYQFLGLSISPDEQEALVVFGNTDMPHDSYSIDERNRSLWNLRLTDGQAYELASAEEDAHTPKWSPNGDLIAYLSRRSGRTEIWVSKRDGTDAHQVTDCDFPARNPFDEASLCWSPDGTHISYTAFPRGSKYALWLQQQEGGDDRIQISGPGIKEAPAPSSFTSSVYVVDIASKNSQQLVNAEEEFRILGWPSGNEQLIVSAGDEIRGIFTATGEIQVLYSGAFDRVDLSGGNIRLARISGTQLEVGLVEEGAFALEQTIELGDQDISLDAWSPDGSRLFGRLREGISTFLFAIDLDSGTLRRLTPPGKSVHPLGPQCLRDGTAIFTYQGPTEPGEIWLRRPDNSSERISQFHEAIIDKELPEVRIVQYPSNGWEIEAILVLPVKYDAAKRYPTLLYAHGGPESNINATFTDLISARAQSAAHFLATQGYAVLLPNFRGSSGYGQDFMNELRDYQIANKPFQDVMAGVDYLIEENIADPELLGIYGDSFGGWLTAWAISQTSRFKGAVASIGLYDLLRFDRCSGKPFYSWNPNRLGNADPKALWTHPEVYSRFSPIEHIASIRTPVLIIETEAERTRAWVHQASMLFNGLQACGVESYLVHYPEAHHNGGWNDKYKRDYMDRLVSWFDHCLWKKPLPERFLRMPGIENE